MSKEKEIFECVVRKNNLPYIQPWSVIRLGVTTKANEVIGNYKTEEQAIRACHLFRECGLPDGLTDVKIPEDAWEAIDQRLKKPDGDKLPKPKLPYSTNRKIELNDD